MNNKQLKQAIIESLAMTITHSEQGDYTKNLEYVKQEVDKIISIVEKNKVEEIREKIESYHPAINALGEYSQADEDGCMVVASRQAIDETLEMIKLLTN